MAPNKHETRNPAYTGDKPSEKPTLERVREWEHGDRGLGKRCPRVNKPVYTKPEALPDTCRHPPCENTEYYSKGIVTRTTDGTIVDRERDRLKEASRGLPSPRAANLWCIRKTL